MQLSAEELTIDVEDLNQAVMLPFGEIDSIRFDTVAEYRPSRKRDWFVSGRSERFESRHREGICEPNVRGTQLPTRTDYWSLVGQQQVPLSGGGRFWRGKFVTAFPTCRLITDEVEFSDEWGIGLSKVSKSNRTSSSARSRKMMKIRLPTLTKLITGIHQQKIFRRFGRSRRNHARPARNGPTRRRAAIVGRQEQSFSDLYTRRTVADDYQRRSIAVIPLLGGA